MSHPGLKSVRHENLIFHYVNSEPSDCSSRGNVVLIHGSLVDLQAALRFLRGVFGTKP